MRPALAAVGRTYLAGPLSGVMVESFGWPVFFLCTFAIALPGLGLLWSQREQVRASRAKRAAGPWRRALDGLAAAARGSEPLMPAILAAVSARATVGEISDTFRTAWGVFRPRP